MRKPGVVGQTGTMIIAFSITTSGTGSLGADAASGSPEATAAGSVSRAVAEAIAVVRASGLPYRTSSMFTEIEGEWDEVMGVIKDCVTALEPYGSRISLVMKADIRPGFTGELDGKLNRLEHLLQSRGESAHHSSAQGTSE